MKIKNKEWRTIWIDEKSLTVNVIDQTKLPHSFVIKNLTNKDEIASAISTMVVRGAPLIGVTGAFGIYLAVKENPSDKSIEDAYNLLIGTRPTAVNLRWALLRMKNKLLDIPISQRSNIALKEAITISNEDESMCEKIGINGCEIISKILQNKIKASNKNHINILTHCNAGWLATVNWGTALAPIYKAFRAGINLNVWVDETRPRNQGASLTAFELEEEGIPYKVIVDNAGGYLMQEGQVDLVIVGSDRISSKGDVCNKIGTYLKALAAKDNNIPFYAALPFSTIDWDIENGKDIPIEARSEKEVTQITGKTESGKIQTIQLTPDLAKAYNPAFDVTPSNLISGIITERGVTKANKLELSNLYNKAS